MVVIIKLIIKAYAIFSGAEFMKNVPVWKHYKEGSIK